MGEGRTEGQQNSRLHRAGPLESGTWGDLQRWIHLFKTQGLPFLGTGFKGHLKNREEFYMC